MASNTFIAIKHYIFYLISILLNVDEHIFRRGKTVIFLPIEKIMSPENMEFNESCSYQSSLGRSHNNRLHFDRCKIPLDGSN